jgi:formylglycine-generating enzyme required for sulfatase activity/tRNA A-37 threonylcarbamoyl transferase component Bud32
MSLEGQQLGEFEIIERIGRGGMGAVYKARQTSLDRIVALKTLQSSLAEDEDYIARFRQEAKVAAALNHPNLVQVISAGESEGQHWFAMEYIEGESANVRLKRKGRLKPLEAVAITIHVATALEYGWRKAGLIHRDIKPDNIFLSSDGEVKLGDLGLAKSAGQAQGLTMTGSSMGTPHYMSPEQVEAMKDVDLRADIYSLGCTLYHLLCGQPPYVGHSSAAVMMKHLNSPAPDLRSAWPECPAELAAAVRKMMQKRPADRQQTYGDVIAALRRACDVLSGTRVPSVIAVAKKPVAGEKKRWAPAVAWLGGGVALLAAIAALVYLAPWKKADAIPGGTRSVASTGATLITATNGQPFVNTLGMKFVPVPILGGPTGGQRVFFSVWDTRVQDYEAFVKETKREWPKVDFEQGPTHPAVNVSWEDAQLFCQWLTQREQTVGRLPAGFSYRLPSDHEWSCAVDLGAREDAVTLPSEKNFKFNDAFPWGSTWPPPKGAGNYAGEELRPAQAAGKYSDIKDLIAGYNDGFVNTSPVGSFAANRFGLFDMGGNAWQWCEDWFDRDQKNHVLRGASWTFSARFYLLSSGRLGFGARGRWLAGGFRCVLTPGPAASPAPAVPVPAVSSTPATATQNAPFVNTLGQEFVPVPGTQALFCRWDTRVKDYAAYARTNKVDDSWTKQEKDGVPISREPDYPVVDVTWDDANAFCQWLTEKERAEGRLPKGMKYRLPTDEEWSRAVGLAKEDGATPKERNGKDQVDFPWGLGFPPPKANVGNYADTAFHEKFPKEPKEYWIEGYTDGYATTSPVGSFPANEYGLYDMGGNVWQWCEDLFEPGSAARVSRGGSWGNRDRYHLLSSCREHYELSFRNYHFGFRCVLAPTPPNAAAPKQAVSSATPTPAPSATPKPATEIEKWFAQMDWPRQADFQKQVLKSFEIGVAELRARYLAALDTASAKASAAGQLADALAWRTERQAFEKARNVAPDDAATPAGVKTLRAAFRQQLARLEEDRAAQAKALFASYDAILVKNQTLLTQQQRLDDALALKTKRDEIARAWLGLTTTPLAADKENPFVNTLGMKFVPMPILGGPTAGQRVLFSVWDTRVQDYEVFWKETNREWPNPVFPQGPTHPAVNVKWEDAQFFCQWLTRREQAVGRLPADWRYRLPSDHEWSCAAGIGAREDAAKLPSEKNGKINDAFPWGNQWPPPKGAGNYSGEEMRPAQAGTFGGARDLIANYNDGFVSTSPVGSFAANRFGLFDIGGNVWQWCEDWFDKDQRNRVLRGASWVNIDRGALLSSYRDRDPPAARNDYNGFRCVLASSGLAANSGEPEKADRRSSSGNAAVGLRSGLIGWWKADGDAWDSAGTHHGAMKGGATFGPGKDGQAFLFNGSTAYVSVPGSPAWAFGKNDWSVALWAKFLSNSGRHALLACDDGPGQNNKWIFWLYDGKLLLHMVGKEPNWAKWLDGVSFAPAAGSWYHLAMTRTGSVFRIYVDGIEKSSEQWPGAMAPPTAPLTIGEAEGYYPFNGMLEDVRIYDRALTAAEIKAIFDLH